MTIYSNAWSDTIPPGTAPANTIDDIFRALRTDIHQRIADLHGITDFTSDPLNSASIRVGYTGHGGHVRITDQLGTLRFLAGCIGNAGNQNYYIYDQVNGTSRFSVDFTTGFVNAYYGFNTPRIVNTAAAGTVALTVTGVADQWSQIIYGSATAGQSLGLVVQAGTTSADKAFEVDSAGGGQYFYIRGDGVGYFNYGLAVAGSLNVGGGVGVTGNITAGSFSGPLAGNVTGNVTGNVSGSSGSCTGNAASASSVAAGGITGSIIDSQITSLSASKLSGALPAISGASLTSITGGNVTGTVASATTAGNATNLGGVAASSYALKNGSSAIVVSGASVTAASFYIV